MQSFGSNAMHNKHQGTSWVHADKLWKEYIHLADLVIKKGGLVY